MESPHGIPGLENWLMDWLSWTIGDCLDRALFRGAALFFRAREWLTAAPLDPEGEEFRTLPNATDVRPGKIDAIPAIAPPADQSAHGQKLAEMARSVGEKLGERVRVCSECPTANVFSCDRCGRVVEWTGDRLSVSDAVLVGREVVFSDLPGISSPGSIPAAPPAAEPGSTPAAEPAAEPAAPKRRTAHTIRREVVEAAIAEGWDAGLRTYPELIEHVRATTGQGCSKAPITRWKRDNGHIK